MTTACTGFRMPCRGGMNVKLAFGLKITVCDGDSNL